MPESASPWRFLSALHADQQVDRDLIHLTRGDELRLVNGMVASSRVSLLYAHSGIGKTSLINAGVIPFFAEEGWAVFKTRPRPPWCIDDPVKAFKVSMARDRILPGVPNAQLEVLERARVRFEEPGADDSAELRALVDQLERQVSVFRDPEIYARSFMEYFEKDKSKTIREFLNGVQNFLGSRVRILIVCDQFEEAFVHFSNTPMLHDFVAQLGDAWADSSLRVQFLFSLREDWVGSMIEFRSAMPDIFTNYFKLGPLAASRAGEALKKPLESVGVEIGKDALDTMLRDLAACYPGSRRGFSQLSADGSWKTEFIELPALQIVADGMWQTRQGQTPPFGLSHYKSLAGSANGAGARSPAAAILDDYCLALLSTEPEMRELQVDTLYLLTDKVRHRRALDEESLLAELKLVRPAGLNLPEVSVEMIRNATRPLITSRLVRKEGTANAGTQYELAHDFAVRAVLKAWQQLDRERIRRLALLTQEQEKTKKALRSLDSRLGLLLLLGPLIPIAALVASFVSLDYPESRSVFLYNVDTAYYITSFIQVWQGIAMAGFAGLAAVGITGKRTWSWIAALMGLAFTILFANQVYPGQLLDTYPFRDAFAFNDIVRIGFAIATGAFVLLFYPKAFFELTGDFKRQYLFVRVLRIMWAELTEFAMLMAGIAASVYFADAVKNWPVGGDAGQFLMITVPLAIYLMLTVAWLRLGQTTPGFLWAGFHLRYPVINAMEIKNRLFRALLRQLALLIWFVISVPVVLWLLVGPLTIWRSRSHSGLYDVITGLEVLPRFQDPSVGPDQRPG